MLKPWPVSQLAKLRDKKMPKMQEMILQFEETEGSCHGSLISPTQPDVFINRQGETLQREKLVLSEQCRYGSSDATNRRM